MAQTIFINKTAMAYQSLNWINRAKDDSRLNNPDAFRRIFGAKDTNYDNQHTEGFD